MGIRTCNSDRAGRLSYQQAATSPLIRQVALILCCCMTWIPAVLAGTTTGQQPLVLGVHPYLSYSQLQLRFAPLARHIGTRLNREVYVRVGRDYDEHIREVGNDRLDIAFIGPVSYVKMIQRFGSKPLLARLQRNGRAVLSGDIIVADDSDIGQIEQLRGKAFAFGDPQSTMSSVVPQALLGRSGIGLDDLGKYTHYRGHANVALAVLTGQADAGAVKREVFQEFRNRGLRSLQMLPEVSEHLFIVRADLPGPLVEQLRDILLDLANSPEGMAALRSLHPQATALVPVDDDDYDTLRAMLIEPTEQAVSRNAEP